MPKCCVPGCSTGSRAGVSLYQFPTDRKITRLWIQAIEKGTGLTFDKNFTTQFKRVCQFHFKEDDYDKMKCSDGSITIKRKKEVIPSVFVRSINKPETQLHVDELTQKKCRVCLKEEGIISIKDHLPKTNISVESAVQSTFYFNFNAQMFFPQMICQRCHKFIIAAHVLNQQILKTDAILKALANEMAKILNQNQMDITNDNADENAVFIIREIDENEIKPELTIEGDQAVFAEIISDDDDDGGNEVIVTEIIDDAMKFEEGEEVVIQIHEENFSQSKKSLDVEKMLEKALEKEIDESEVVYEEWPEDESESGEGTSNFKEIPVEMKYKCKKCTFQSRTKFELFDHIDNSEEGCSELYDFKLECLICNKKFPLKRMKKAHILKEHQGVCVNNECPHCKVIKKSFENPVSYEHHLHYHLRAPTKICPTCGKGFYRDHSLWTHKQIHKGQLFSCDFCNFKTTTKALIGHHMKKHNRGALSVCHRCSKSVCNLDCHLFSVHKISENGCYYCKSCDFCFLKRFQFKLHTPMCKGPNGKKYPADSVRIPRKELDSSCRIIQEL